jgi:DNA repair exonuclease SbcCD ATPase subunit
VQPTSISLTNFKSIRKLDIDLIPFNDKVVLISASNLDEEGASSNRSGKSNLIRGFIWVLFGVKFIDSVNDEITTYGETETIGIIRFGNIEIERRLKKGAQSFFYRVNGVEKSESNKDSSDLFLKEIGLDSANKVIISNSIYLNSEVDNLIKASPADRLKILTAWLNLSMYDDAVTLTRDKIKEWECTLANIDAIVEKAKDIDISKLNIKKDELLWNWQIHRDGLVELQEAQKVFNNYLAISKQAFALKQKLELIESANKRINKAEEYVNQINIKELEQKLSEIVNSNIELNIERRRLLDESKSLSKQITSPIYCPKCNAALVHSSGKLIEVSAENNTRILELISAKKTEYDSLPLMQDDSEIRELINKYNQAKVIADQELTDTTDLQKELHDLFLPEKPKDNSLEINELTVKIGVAEREIGRIESEIEYNLRLIKEAKEKENESSSFKERIRLGELWAGRRTSGLFQQIKSLQLSNIISNLEILSNNYLNNHFGILSKIKIEPTAKGINIYQDYQGLHPIESMSGGEKSRVAFSIALALKDIYSSKLDILFVDEFFSSLDETGMTYCINVLSKLKGMKFLVSHNPVECENEIHLIKENGVTRYDK